MDGYREPWPFSCIVESAAALRLIGPWFSALVNVVKLVTSQVSRQGLSQMNQGTDHGFWIDTATLFLALFALLIFSLEKDDTTPNGRRIRQARTSTPSWLFGHPTPPIRHQPISALSRGSA